MLLEIHGRTLLDWHLVDREVASTLQFNLVSKSRSMGVKLIVVCVLALLMTIPALFVAGLVEDRSSRAAEVVREIGSHVGGHVGAP